MLNPSLYKRLSRNFGEPLIVSEDEAMIARAVEDVRGKRLSVAHAGEYYRINCPYCHDTRRRLYVNHMFGQVDGHGRRMNYVAHCYNENCLDEEENLEDFTERLDSLYLTNVRILPGKTVSEEARQVLPPGHCVLLSDLPKRHKARQYVTERNFDPDVLSRLYSVSYCESSRYSLARDRLIIPVYDQGILKGWQARYIGELDWKGPRKHELPPKYFSCPDSKFRSRCILNFDGMKAWYTGVLVEGPTDVFSYGRMAGCIFGNTVTEFQMRRFVAIFRNRSGILLLDPEEFESKSTQRFLSLMQAKMPHNFCAVKLPDGSDPGSLDRKFLRRYVQQEAAKQGVEVRYEKVQ